MESAWDQGYDAWTAGLPATANPYPADTQAWSDWLNGWWAADEDDAWRWGG